MTANEEKMTLISAAEQAISALKTAFPEAEAVPHLTAATLGIEGLRQHMDRKVRAAARLAELAAQG